MVTGVRRRAREQALQVLFGMEYYPIKTDRALKNFLEITEETIEDLDYLQAIVSGVAQFVDELNEMIKRHSTNWRLERMAVVDKNILRIACYELCHQPEVPHKVIINEAIEIAKKYGSEDSPAFVNGVLDRIAVEARPGEAQPAETPPSEVGE